MWDHAWWLDNRGHCALGKVVKKVPQVSVEVAWGQMAWGTGLTWLLLWMRWETVVELLPQGMSWKTQDWKATWPCVRVTHSDHMLPCMRDKEAKIVQKATPFCTRGSAFWDPSPRSPCKHEESCLLQRKASVSQLCVFVCVSPLQNHWNVLNRRVTCSYWDFFKSHFE